MNRPRGEPPRVGVTFTIITYASLLYAGSAQRISRQAQELDDPETWGAADADGRARIEAELLDAALGAVTTANFAVEATVNELYLDASLFPNGGMFKGLTQDIRQALFDSWRHGAEWQSVVTKCQIAAAICGKPRIEFGRGIGQQMDKLIKLRNSLVHHKPVPIEGRGPRHESDDDIERLLNHSFERARIWDGRGVQFRWNGCLGGPCARWALEVSTGFMREFFGQLGTTYPNPV